MSSTLGDSITAALGGDQEPSDLAAAEVVAVVHHCIYCYTLWNTRASRTCAGPSEKLGTERYILFRVLGCRQQLSNTGYKARRGFQSRCGSLRRNIRVDPVS
jgi:hypothetical protein